MIYYQQSDFCNEARLQVLATLEMQRWRLLHVVLIGRTRLQLIDCTAAQSMYSFFLVCMLSRLPHLGVPQKGDLELAALLQLHRMPADLGWSAHIAQHLSQRPFLRHSASFIRCCAISLPKFPSKLSWLVREDPIHA